jgi:hypothetical protein
MVTIIGELVTTLAVTSNRRMLRRTVRQRVAGRKHHLLGSTMPRLSSDAVASRTFVTILLTTAN